jgi:hypothetical protein
MLAYLLALAVGLGSSALYLTASLFPAIHRKYDFFWGGVGLFYGLVLWVCAGRIAGGLLLGQLAGVSLLGWFGWQMMQMRWEQLPPEKRSIDTESFQVVVKERAHHFQTRLQNSQWRSSSFTKINGGIEKSIELAIALLDWSIALIGTTVKSWEPPRSLEQPQPLEKDSPRSPDS